MGKEEQEGEERGREGKRIGKGGERKGEKKRKKGRGAAANYRWWWGLRWGGKKKK